MKLIPTVCRDQHQKMIELALGEWKERRQDLDAMRAQKGGQDTPLQSNSRQGEFRETSSDKARAGRLR